MLDFVNLDAKSWAIFFLMFLRHCFQPHTRTCAGSLSVGDGSILGDLPAPSLTDCLTSCTLRTAHMKPGTGARGGDFSSSEIAVSMSGPTPRSTQIFSNQLNDRVCTPCGKRKASKVGRPFTTCQFRHCLIRRESSRLYPFAAASVFTFSAKRRRFH